jgi:ATP phosphoribosyltransferase
MEIPVQYDGTSEMVRLALPDGHQQVPALEILNKAGIQVDDYPSAAGNRRPKTNLEGVVVKVIRPQDMPLQVANGNFDLAITGRDWLREHLYQFPSSPVKEFVDLKFGKVKIVAVVSQTMPVDDAYTLEQFTAEQSMPFRVASEYINIADKFARENHLGHYRVVPTWGATEAFLPEDADLLIENTQTGQTIARHNLKTIDTLFESTACLIGNTGIKFGSQKGERVKSIIDSLRIAVGES